MANTTNYYIKPQDGWVQVATDTNYIRISNFPSKHPYLVWYGSSLPATADQVGIYVCHKPFWINVSAPNNFWVKVPNPVPGGITKDGALRVDVIAF